MKFTDTELYQNFNQGEGLHLLYGLETTRRIVKPTLRNKIATNLPVTADDYNNILVTRFSATNAPTNVDEETTRLTPNKQAYLAYLQNVSPKPALSISNTKFPHNPKNRETEDRTFTRACKAAILKRNVIIHFCLDNIDLQAVFTEAFKNPLYTSHTSAELRFIARNWESVKDRVHFYHSGQEVTPQWQTVEGKQNRILVNHLSASSLAYLDFGQHALIVQPMPPAAPSKGKTPRRLFDSEEPRKKICQENVPPPPSLPGDDDSDDCQGLPISPRGLGRF